MGPIRSFLDTAYQTKTIYPPKEDLFKALELTPMDQVKVVILGQDPYHGPNQAQGLAFSVPATQKIPPSLQNIYKELELEYQQPIYRTGDLQDWAKQGVLLLNTSLSVEQGKPNSHSKIGWNQFTDDVLRALNDLDQPMVFILWGYNARQAARFLNNPNHLVLQSVHPSPLSAHKGFFGCNHFKQANSYLEANGLTPINWIEDNVEGLKK